MRTTLILGIGNNLLGDEGIGIHVVRHLSEQHPDEPGVTFLDGGTLSFTLAEPIAEHDNLIVVDAARFGQPAGAVRCFEGDRMDRYLTGNRQSVHEVGLTDLLDISRLSGTFPAHRALIGIEPALLDWAEYPSPQVAPTIGPVAGMALELARRWRKS
jgi:hydrogenase maturation protease